MSLRKLPSLEVKALDGLTWDAPSDALARWSQTHAAEADDPNVISIYDVIGADPWTGEGVTDKRVAGALRKIGPNEVTVNINSPGGSFFDGLAIYNLLREHPAKVTVKVMGMAASAASVIAMAGDEIKMGAGTFLMIHNAWAVAIGNRHDMEAAAKVLEPFDRAMAELYAARAGTEVSDIEAMMDAETWLTAKDAIDAGLADEVFNLPAQKDKEQARADVSAKRKLDAILAQQGMPRSERRRLMRDLSGMPSAASVTHDADDLDSLRSLTEGIRKLI